MSDGKSRNYFIVIDDDKISNLICSKIFEEIKVADRVDYFNSATKALSELQKEETPKPNIIFLDINMPRMNGWEFMENSRDLLKKHEVKVIILTTSIDYRDEARAENYPEIVDYMVKPLSIKTFKEVLDRI